MAGHLKTMVQDKNPYLLLYRLEKKYISQKVAAERAGISRSVWMGLENDSIIPTEEIAEKIAQLIGLPASNIFPRGCRTVTQKRIPLRVLSKLTLIRRKRGLSQDDLIRLVYRYLRWAQETRPTRHKLRKVISALDWRLPILNDEERIVKAIAGALRLAPEDIISL